MEGINKKIYLDSQDIYVLNPNNAVPSISSVVSKMDKDSDIENYREHKENDIGPNLSKIKKEYSNSKTNETLEYSFEAGV